MDMGCVVRTMGIYVLEQRNIDETVDAPESCNAWDCIEVDPKQKVITCKVNLLMV